MHENSVVLTVSVKQMKDMSLGFGRGREFGVLESVPEVGDLISVLSCRRNYFVRGGMREYAEALWLSRGNFLG